MGNTLTIGGPNSNTNNYFSNSTGPGNNDKTMNDNNNEASDNNIVIRLCAMTIRMVIIVIIMAITMMVIKVIGPEMAITMIIMGKIIAVNGNSNSSRGCNNNINYYINHTKFFFHILYSLY